ncbi:MAG: alanine racemase, partial [Candidatus Thermoplasmatota archaeon]|nr:alanine racemase [Candidatus Thermoplasmatota archaeon]
MLPNIEIDLQKIKDNTKEIVRLCAAANMEVAGVTKSVCGDCKIAGALVEGGVMQIADSRIRNIAKLREAGLNTEFMLLRSPGRSSIEETVKYADITLLSEMEIIKSIGKEAVEQGTEHGAVLMADLGDRREG